MRKKEESSATGPHEMCTRFEHLADEEKLRPILQLLNWQWVQGLDGVLTTHRNLRAAWKWAVGAPKPIQSGNISQIVQVSRDSIPIEQVERSPANHASAAKQLDTDPGPPGLDAGQLDLWYLPLDLREVEGHGVVVPGKDHGRPGPVWFKAAVIATKRAPDRGG